MRSFESLKREAKLREAIFNDKNVCKAKIYQFGKSLGYCLSDKNLFLRLELETGEVEAEKVSSTCSTKMVDSGSKARIITDMKPFIDNNYLENEFKLLINKSGKNPRISILANYTEEVSPEKTIHTHFNTLCPISKDLEWLLVIYPNYTSIPIIFGFNSSFGIKKYGDINYTSLFDESAENSDYSFTSFYNEFSVSKTETVSTNIPSIKLDTEFVKANNYLSAVDLDLIPESNKVKIFNYEDEYFISTVYCDGSSMVHYLKGENIAFRYYDSSMIPFTDIRIFDTSEDIENQDIKTEFEKYLYLMDDHIDDKDRFIGYRYYPAKYNIKNHHYRSYIVKYEYGFKPETPLFRIDIFGNYEYIRYISHVNENISIKLYKVESIKDSILLNLLMSTNCHVANNDRNYLSYYVDNMYKENTNIWSFSRSNDICQIRNYAIETMVDIKDKKIISSNNILSRDINHTFFLNELGLPININYIDNPNSKEE